MKYPVTAAIRFLKSQGVKYTEHLYTYEDRGGTAVSSRELCISDHGVVKTLIIPVSYPHSTLPTIHHV